MTLPTLVEERVPFFIQGPGSHFEVTVSSSISDRTSQHDIRIGGKDKIETHLLEAKMIIFFEPST